MSGAKWGGEVGASGAQLELYLASNWTRRARACADGAEAALRARENGFAPSPRRLGRFTRALLVEAAAEPIFHAAGE